MCSPCLAWVSSGLIWIWDLSAFMVPLGLGTPPPPPVGLTWSLRGLHNLGVRRSECLTSDLSGLMRPSGQARYPCYPSIPTGYTWLKMLLNNVNNNSSKTNYARTYLKNKIGRNWHFIRNQHRTLYWLAVMDEHCHEIWTTYFLYYIQSTYRCNCNRGIQMNKLKFIP